MQFNLGVFTAQYELNNRRTESSNIIQIKLEVFTAQYELNLQI